MSHISYVVYNSGTGEIIRHGHCVDSDLSIQAQSGEAVIQGEYQPGTVVDGVLVPLNATQIADRDAAYRQASIANHRAMRKQTLN